MGFLVDGVEKSTPNPPIFQQPFPKTILLFLQN